MGRYGDIRRAKELGDALTKLREWEDKTLKEKRAAYKAQRGTSVRVKVIRAKGYVESFELQGRIYLPVKLLSDNQTGGNATTLANVVREAVQTSGRTLAVGFELPTGGLLLDNLTGYRPAKLSLTDRGAEVADSKSRITDLEYKRYDNKSVSSAFGSKATGSEPYADAVAEISDIASIKAFAQKEGNRVSFIPEVI
ncbi:MAG: hypothetical protein RMY16_13275 [Nostoc sp. DedQUE12b]|uniref:hypothetical protein n=1 Tax=Nostoc sp. DedQUE12b TaxID=3075398 RepID=UPI002AD45B88|nr:hypothetical protein [Nostoc sp. DedQUE12b]MDZ8086510.1 hypothetical protein [Nostoc sp. DedQUE12b]